MKIKTPILYIGNKLSKHGRTPTAIDWLSDKLEEIGYQVTTASSKKNKLLRLMEMIRKTIALRKSVSFVLIDTYSTQNYYYAVIIGWICRFFSIKYIPILRGGNLPDRIKKSNTSAKQLFGKSFKNVALSNYLMERFVAAGFKNTVVIPNIIFLENYTYSHRKTISNTLLWVRSFAKIYNPILAINVLEELIKKDSNATLTMVGPEKDGSLEFCKSYAEQKNLPVTFTGKLSKKEWLKLSKNFDVFINTTNFDNTPISVIEAMALGLPVISTNVGGVPFLLDNNEDAILVPPNNVNVFVEAILKLGADLAFTQEITKKARKKVEGFDWEIVKNLWVELLK